MSEKLLASSGDSFVDLTQMETVDLLNELSDDNTKLHKKVEEQQATIRKLQDLCGQSDGENMKLRIENKRLEKEVNLLRPTNIEQYEQIQKLQKENEQLQKIIDLTQYQLKVQDRILKEVGE